MGDFRHGEIVNVTIKGVRIARPRSTSAVTIADEHGAIYEMPPQAAVERVPKPLYWPPSAGEVWQDRNRNQWLVQRRPDGRVRMIPAFLSSDDDPDTVDLPEHLLAYLGPLERIFGEDPPF